MFPRKKGANLYAFKKEWLEPRIHEDYSSPHPKYLLKCIVVARDGLKVFTEAYRPLSPYDKKRAMTELIHSVEYGKDKVSIRYYVLDETEVLLNKEGAATHRNGFATPPTWRR